MNRLCLLILIAIATISCRNKSVSEVSVTAKTFVVDANKHTVDTLIINNNDTAFVVKNKVSDKDKGTESEVYEIHVMFSNKKWPVLHFKNAIGADLYVVEDLDGDDEPELLLRPEWFNSCWSSINLFSLKEGGWHLVKSGGMYFCADQHPLPARIEKQNEKYYLITDTIINEKFVVDGKEIEF
ncbi:hypothetical protein [Pedobacter sp.]